MYISTPPSEPPPPLLCCTDCGSEWHSEAARQLIVRQQGCLLCGGTVAEVLPGL
jgi:hypothetical protein